MGGRPPNSDHDPFSGASLALGSALERLSWSSLDVIYNPLLLHITIRLRNGLLHRQREDTLPRGMEWGGRREEGSGWGTHVYLWRIHFDIWQN